LNDTTAQSCGSPCSIINDGKKTLCAPGKGLGCHCKWAGGPRLRKLYKAAISNGHGPSTTAPASPLPGRLPIIAQSGKILPAREELAQGLLPPPFAARQIGGGSRHIAQPTASVQIRKLSETIGLPLFEQVGKRVYLTGAGQRVYRGCNEVFRTIRNIEEGLTEMRSLHSGHLQLAVSSSAKYFTPRLLGTFIERFPGIQTLLQIHNRSTLIERLGNNQDDLYLFAAAPDHPEVVVQALLHNPLEVFARSDHPLAGEKNIVAPGQ
jgi:LysR substrate binding domain/Bacterial regulatory helix-turn-helix protein, lysR family